MRWNYVIWGLLFMILGAILYQRGISEVGQLFSWSGLLGIVAGLLMKREPTELEKLQTEREKLQIEELKRKLRD